MSYKLHSILVAFCVLLFYGCSNDDHFTCEVNSTGKFQDLFDGAKGNEKYDAIEGFFQSIVNDSLFIISAQFVDQQSFFIKAEDGRSLCVPNFFIKNNSFSFNGEILYLNLTNGATISAPHFEKWENLLLSTVEIDPFGVNPLCAAWDVEIPRSAILELIILGKYGSSSDIKINMPLESKTEMIPILGLYENYENKIVTTFTSNFGSIYFQDTLVIKTNLINTQTAAIEIISQLPDKIKPGMNLVSSLSHPNYDVPYMFDDHGELRWILDFKNIPALDRLAYDVGIARLKNGNWYFGDMRSNKIYEFGLLGNVVNSWDLGGYQFHHNVYEKSNGNFLVTVSDPSSRHLNGRRTNEDFIIEIDRSSDEIINLWDLKQSLDEYRTSFIDNLSNPIVDWIHVNAVYSDDNDGSIIISGRHQGVVKLTHDNRVMWILAPHRNWSINRRSEDLNKYLLQPIDGNGNTITDTLVVNGYENDPEFEWNWGQHAVRTLANGNLILFDNGDRRNYKSSPQYSRIVEYKIDESNLTVQQVWTYGKELGSTNFSRIVSNVEYDEETQHFFMNSGISIANVIGNGGSTREIDRATKEVVFHASIKPPTDFITFHRINRLSMYAE